MRASILAGSEIKLVFGIPPDRPMPNFAPTYNLAPTDPIPILRVDSADGLCRLDVVRWGDRPPEGGPDGMLV